MPITKHQSMKVLDDNSVLVPAGKYVLGDPCYAVHHNLWDSLLSSCECFDKPVGAVKDKFGYDFEVMAFPTFYGDGVYTGNDNFEYGVDTGLIGLVPFDLAVTESWQNKFSSIVNFERETLCFNDNGVLYFGNVVIDTANHEYEDYDDE